MSNLVFNEVITGFRLGMGGAQGYFSIEPDIACLGKIIGGGFPVGAFGARNEIMDLLAPDGPVYQAGTLSGNPVAMQSGLAVLRILETESVHEVLNHRAVDFINRLKSVVEPFKVTVNHIGSMFSLFFSAKPIMQYTDVQSADNKRFRSFYKTLLSEGIYLSPSPYETNFISLGHSGSQLMKTVESIKRALERTI